MTNKRIILIAILLIGSAIILGAFVTHTLKEKISDEHIQSFEVGVRYQLYNALALLVIMLNEQKFNFSMSIFYKLLLSGTFLFSGSIYLLALQETLGFSFRFLWPITPIGGLLMISAWVLLFIKILKIKN